ncbi:MAG: PH domain-containing protein [Lachnospiraceae bacterium]|nr:PH domain-containing protein [Lachnospiraceae bacterium]
MVDIKWKQRKRIWCGLPWTFTVYSLSEDRLFIDSGVFTKRQDEVRLYRVLDVSLKRSLGQRIFGMGTIRICSSDKTMKDFDLINIKNSKDVKEMISEYVETQREKKRVVSREYMSDGHDEESDLF